jgi:hypothetical protein
MITTLTSSRTSYNTTSGDERGEREREQRRLSAKGKDAFTKVQTFIVDVFLVWKTFKKVIGKYMANDV